MTPRASKISITRHHLRHEIIRRCPSRNTTIQCWINVSWAMNINLFRNKRPAFQVAQSLYLLRDRGDPTRAHQLCLKLIRMLLEEPTNLDIAQAASAAHELLNACSKLFDQVIPALSALDEADQALADMAKRFATEDNPSGETCINLYRSRLSVWRFEMDNANSLEEAVQQALYALEVPQETEHQPGRLFALVTLGLLLRRRRQRGDLEEALKYFREMETLALKVGDEVASRNARHNLAVTLLDVSVAGQGGGFPEAVRLLEELLNEYPPGSEERVKTVILWATTTFHHPDDADRSVLLERAKDELEGLLDGGTATRNEVTRIQARIALAEVLFYRLRGDRTENLEGAREHADQALTEAVAQGLGKEAQQAIVLKQQALSEHGGFETAKARQDIIGALLKVRDTIDRATRPREWASVTSTVGTVLSELGASSLECAKLAVNCQREACETLKHVDAPDQLLIGAIELAAALTRAAEHHPNCCSFDEALGAYRWVIDLIRDAPNTRRWRIVNANYARTLALSGNLKQAVEVCDEVLKLEQDAGDPRHHQNVRVIAGRALFDLSEWTAALEHFEVALGLTDDLLLEAATDYAERLELGKITGVPGMAAYCHVKLGQVQHAAEVLERYRARILAKNLRRRQEEGYGERDDLNNRVRDRELDLGEPYTELATALRGLASASDDHLPLEAIQDVADQFGHPLVYAVCTSQGSLMLVVWPGGTAPEAVWSALTERDLTEFMYPSGDGEQYRYTDLMYATTEKAPWADSLFGPDGWESLGRRLLEPLFHRLDASQSDRIGLVPFGLLTLLPMHLHGSTPARHSVSFVHSARLLELLLHERDFRRNRARRLVAIGNPQRDDKRSLLRAQLEAEVVVSKLGVDHRLLVGADATRERLIDELEHATHLYFAGHAAFDRIKPLESGWFLAGRDTLTVQEVYGLGKRTSALCAVIMSACQSGVVEGSRAPDEPLGFQSAWAELGVPSVIGTLWNVNDGASLLLMAQFADFLAASGDLCDALHKAQQWACERTYGDAELVAFLDRTPDFPDDLRASLVQPDPRRVFPSPRYWAGFACWGV